MYIPPYLFCVTAGVTIGFKHTNHTVLEGSLITLCVGVLSGGLGRDVSLQLQTQNITALGM